MAEDKIITVKIPGWVHRKLREIYVHDGRSMTSVVNEAIIEWFTKHEDTEDDG